MKATWNYYRTCLGFGPDAPKATELDIKETPQRHYSFIFKTAAGNPRKIEVTATWDYFDKRTWFTVPARGNARLEEITALNDYELGKAHSWLRDAGITEENFGDFMRAGRRILDK